MKRVNMMVRACLVMLVLVVSAVAGTKVPSELPRPDKTPPNTKKPIKVYLLAGQSNMVGFGTLKGGSPRYSSIFLSADPSVLPAVLPFGRTAILSHGVYQSADNGAAE